MEPTFAPSHWSQTLTHVVHGLEALDLSGMSKGFALWAAYLAGVLLIGAAFRFRGGVWRWMSSAKAAMVLLVVVALVSILGTLINPLEVATRLVYYAWWYEALLLLLGTGIATSTVQIIRARIHSRRNEKTERSVRFFDQAKVSDRFAFRGGIDTATEALRAQGFEVRASGLSARASKGKWGQWGAPIAHAGFLLVLLGGFLSGWVAQRAHPGPLSFGQGHDEGHPMLLIEGDVTNRMSIAGPARREAPLGYTLRCDAFETGFFPHTTIPSKFITTLTVLEAGKPPRTERVEVNHSPRVAGWRYHQTNWREIPGLDRFLLAIGHDSLPTTVSLELSPGQKRIVPALDGAEIELAESFPFAWRLRLANGEEAAGFLDIAGEALTLRPERFEPDLVIEDGQPTSRSREPNNPGLLVALYEGDTKVDHRWLFGRPDLKDMMGRDDGPFEFDLAEVAGQNPDWRFKIMVKPRGADAAEHEHLVKMGDEILLRPAPTSPEENPAALAGWRVRTVGKVPVQGTFLTMTRNPVIPFVYLGCAVMVAGLFAAFAGIRREVWLAHDPHTGELRVAATYRHPRDDFDPALRRALDAMRDQNAAK